MIGGIDDLGTTPSKKVDCCDPSPRWGRWVNPRTVPLLQRGPGARNIMALQGSSPTYPTSYKLVKSFTILWLIARGDPHQVGQLIVQQVTHMIRRLTKGVHKILYPKKNVFIDLENAYNFSVLNKGCIKNDAPVVIKTL